MAAEDWIGDWGDWDEAEIEPNYFEYDRIIHETEKAVLYGMNELKFWLPKSVHSVLIMNTIVVDSWFIVRVFI